MAMFPIATSGTLTSNTNTIYFAGLFEKYTHLQVRIYGRGTTSFSGGLSIYIAPVGKTISASRRHWLSGSGTTAFSNTDAGYGIAATIADGSAPANTFSNVILDILDWNNPNKAITYKSIGGFDSNGGGIATLGSGLQTISGGTLTGISFNTDGDWATGTRIDLYGITTAAATGA